MLSVVASVVYLVLWLFLALLFVRFIVDWVQVFARSWTPTGPVLVVLDAKSGGCMNPRHVSGLPLYDYREALRPSTRLGPPEEEEFEEEN